jgi:hypothetical protein
MKTMIGIICLLLLFPLSAMAKPIAPPVPYTKDFVKKSGKSEKELIDAAIKRMPRKEEVDVPAYPGAYYYQSNESEGGKLMSVVLVARDAPEKVRAWYKEKYSGKNKVEIKPFTFYEWMAQMMDMGDMKTEIWISIK